MKLSKITALCEMATPGPWFMGYWSGRCHEDHGQGGGGHGGAKCKYQYRLVSDGGISHHYVSAGDANNPISIVTPSDEYGALEIGDARFIASARNVVPLLLSVAEAAIALRKLERSSSAQYPELRSAYVKDLDTALAALEGAE